MTRSTHKETAMALKQKGIAWAQTIRLIITRASAPDDDQSTARLESAAHSLPSWACILLSKKYRTRGNVAVAKRITLAGLARSPKNVLLLKEGAKISEARKEWDQVKSSWKKILQAGSTGMAARAMSHIIDAHCKLGEFDEAQALMEAHLARYPNHRYFQKKRLSPEEIAFCNHLGVHPMAYADYEYRLKSGKNSHNAGNNMRTESPEVLHVTANPRFGNTIIQLSNALNLARTLNVREIWLPGFWYLQEQFATRDGIVVKNPPSADECSRMGKSILAGDFFQRKYFFDVLTPNRLPISSFLGQECLRLNAPLPLGKRDLVIHLRAGDVFRVGEKVHPDYGQPPLSFYEKILASGQWDSVTIVCEDDGNPVLLPLLDYARSSTGTVTRKSGSLKEDIECLLSARVLVASSGTFIPAIAELSENLDTMFCFNNETTFTSNTDVIVDVKDRTGEYVAKVMRGNWENTPSQRSLMLHYPMENLDITSYSLKSRR